MAEVFGSKGRQNTAGPPSGKSHAMGSGPVQAQTHYVEYDNDTGAMNIVLPPHLAHYQRELMTAVHEEFFLANPDETTFGGISEYIDNWINEREGSRGSRR